MNEGSATTSTSTMCLRISVRALVLGSLLWLVTAPALADPPASAECPDHTSRLQRDCEQEAADLDVRLNALLEAAARLPQRDGLRNAAQDGLRNLRLSEIQLCRDWNVCAVSPDMYRARALAMGNEIVAAARLIDLAMRQPRQGRPALAAWASGLESRVAMGPGPAPGTPVATVPPSVIAQLQESVRSQEEQLSHLEAARNLVARVRSEFTIPEDGSAPAACGHGSTIRADLDAAIQSRVSTFTWLTSLQSKMDRMCRDFDQWLSPDERMISRGLSFIQSVHRVEGFLHRIQSCVEREGWSGSCENNFGAQPERAVRQVQQALRLLARADTALEHVPDGAPFPCRARIWAELREAEFEARIVRINVPPIGVRAASLCSSIGVLPAELAEKLQALRDDVAQRLASFTQQATQTRTTIQRLRENLHRFE